MACELLIQFLEKNYLGRSISRIEGIQIALRRERGLEVLMEWPSA
jgi:hypothetical protein